MSPPSVFPPEIYDKIIDEVSSSKEALSACSLVERSWIPRSRSHMFRDINFTTPESTETTRTKQRQLTPGGSRHTDAFQQHVASNADVASYARRLVLTLTSSGNIASDIPQASELLNLHSLTLRCSNIIIYAVNDAVLTRLLSFIRHNQHLEYIALYSLVIDPSAFDVFIKCISIRAPRLQSLHLHSVWGPDWTPTAGWSQRGGRLSQSTHHHRVRSLTKLCVSHCESGAISTFLAAFDLQSLERLALINLDWDTCDFRSGSLKTTSVYVSVSVLRKLKERVMPTGPVHALLRSLLSEARLSMKPDLALVRKSTLKPICRRRRTENSDEKSITAGRQSLFFKPRLTSGISDWKRIHHRWKLTAAANLQTF
ncbi:hypothetical protein EV360DRAFT_66551 [Lentinula raphanica]|nr:hypothetical protein EV360DRAFT_66551 [Lentinula raphanica]